MHPDTLLAYVLNGETLPRDHGYPVRALVPGWVGSANIKWLGSIVVSSEQGVDTKQHGVLRPDRRRISS